MSNQLKLLACDLDGVLAFSYANIRKIAKERHGLELDEEGASSWSYLERKIGREPALAVYRDMWVDWENVPPMEPNVSSYVNELTDIRRVFIVTTRQGIPDILNVTKWIEKNINAPITGLVTIDIMSGLSKAAFMPPFEEIIDDNPWAAKDVAHNGFTIFLRNQPYNQKLPPEVEQKVVRVDSLGDVVQKLKYPVKDRVA